MRLCSTLRAAALLACLLTGCQRAHRFTAEAPPAAPAAAPADPEAARRLAVHGWLEGDPPRHIPIVFVPPDSPRWAKLTDFWSHTPPPAAGMRTLHIGQTPLGAAVAFAATAWDDVIEIKVPDGLPDPTPHIPEGNPPNFAAWLLGKKLFYDPGWLVAGRAVSCASCHQPGHGFTEPQPPAGSPGETVDGRPRELRMNAPSLINSVYNRHQFWDGRVRTIEETLQADPGGGAADALGDLNFRHRFHGIVPRLADRPDYVAEFERAFGIPQPTVDAAAKALATYVRTILSGDSVYDQARRQAALVPGPLAAEHFEPFLTPGLIRGWARGDADKAAVAAELARGSQLFFSVSTRCSTCHSGPLFTDHGFHNVGVRESDWGHAPGQEYGRFRQVPLGLKEARLIGAFRTPTLRHLPRTAPYFHDGRYKSLEEVVRHYSDRLDAQFNPYLDPLLRTGPRQARRLNLTTDEVDALALFLYALDGGPVPAVVAGG